MSEPQKSRENRLAEAFVTLADTLVTGFDVADLFVDLAGACVELLEVTAAGLMLVDAGGRLRVMASSSERSRLLELMEIQDDEGPCLDCHREGTPVLVDDLAAQRDRWPSFADQAIRFGFGAVYALPLRLREEAIGALNLFHRDPYAISPADLRIGQALADVATIGVLQQRAVQRGAELSEQLQTALNSRLIIEQAKGVIAERDNMDMDAAFALLRGHARRTRQPFSDIAGAVVAGEARLGARASHVPARDRPESVAKFTRSARRTGQARLGTRRGASSDPPRGQPRPVSFVNEQTPPPDTVSGPGPARPAVR